MGTLVISTSVRIPTISYDASLASYDVLMQYVIGSDLLYFLIKQVHVSYSTLDYYTLNLLSDDNTLILIFILDFIYIN